MEDPEWLIQVNQIQIFCRLSENPVSVFDPKMNNSFLQECIKRVLVMYDALRKTDAALTKSKKCALCMIFVFSS